MAALDEFQFRPRVDGEKFQSQSPLVQRIVEHFRLKDVAVDGSGDCDLDLLSAVLSGHSDLEKKRLIASVAQLVIESSDPKAVEIVDSAVRSLQRLLRPMVNNSHLNPEESILVLAGGLMKSETFAGHMKFLLEQGKKKLSFKSIEIVEQPALAGAEELFRQRRGAQNKKGPESDSLKFTAVGKDGQ